MQGLAAFIMRGRMQATLVVLAASVVSLLSWFGAAVLGLVTLRRGATEGVVVAASAGALLAAFYWALVGEPRLVLPLVWNLWLPTLVLTYWLRRTVSLASTLRLAGTLAALVVLTVHLLYPDQRAMWAPLLEELGTVAGEGSPDAQQGWRDFSESVAPVLTGLLVLSLEATVLLALLLARWMQALLYYPGGFRREFHSLNLGRGTAVAVAVLLLLAAFSGYGLMYDLALAVSAMFVLQGLAFAHVAVSAQGLSRVWLVLLYVLLPLLAQVVVAVGIADAVFGWRRRYLKNAGRGDSI